MSMLRFLVGAILMECVMAGSTLARDVVPITGTRVPELEVLDDLVREFMTQQPAAGVSLAVRYQGKLVYARGFGYADVEAREVVEPQSLFRIASISKPFTAVAILKLVEQGKVELDAPIFELLKIEPFVKPGESCDPRVRQITVLQCLQHTGGWDRGVSGDCMFKAKQIAEAMNIAIPPGANDIIRFMQGFPLDFDPGTKYAYSNFGYCLLGRLIEQVSGQTYTEFVQQQVQEPLGIKNMCMGRSLLEHRAKGEVKYHQDTEHLDSVFKPGEKVPPPYGTFHFEPMDSHGGWVANAAELARFAEIHDKPGQCPLLSEKSFEVMLAKPSFLADNKPQEKSGYYGCGWRIDPTAPGNGIVEHGGLLAGASTIMVHRNDGVNFAILFNSRYTKDEKTLAPAITPLLHKAFDSIKEWPTEEVDFTP